jgi:tetratricopeptide (TPR) repeat protein
MSYLYWNRFKRLSLPVLFLAAPVFAGAGTLDVKCVDQGGNALSGVQIQVQQIGTGKWKDKKSDGKGVARFDKLDEGIYRVVARQQGFAPALYEFARIKEGAQETVSLNFEPGDSARKLYFEDQSLGQKSMEALQQGVEALKASKFDEAEKQIRASIELNPSNPEAQFNLAIAYAQQNKWEPAENALRKASELSAMLAEIQQSSKPSEPNPYKEIQQRADGLRAKLPGLKLRMEANEQMSKRNFKEAIAKFQEALKSFPDDPDAYYNLAIAQANAGLYDEATQSVDKAMQLKPGEKAYGDLKKQIADYKVNAALKNAQSVLDQGQELFKKGDYAGALQKYEEARPMIQGKKQAIAWSLIAKAHAQLNHPDQAIESYKKAMELVPEEANYRKELAQYYLSQKRYDEALELYSDPGGAGSEPVDQTLFDLGQKMSKQGNADVAQLAFEKALKANPNNAEAYYELGMAYFYNKKDRTRAKQMLTKYLELGKDKDHLNNTRSVLVVIERRK